MYPDLKAAEILAVTGEAAKARYGEAAREKLRTIGIASSKSLGDLLYRLIEKGILHQSGDDSIDDFRVEGAFDDFLKEN